MQQRFGRNWARSALFGRGLSHEVCFRAFPNQNLRFPKTTDKPPFQTRVEIERRISYGGVSEAAKRELWDCLFLTVSETEEILKLLKENAAYDFSVPDGRAGGSYRGEAQ